MLPSKDLEKFLHAKVVWTARVPRALGCKENPNSRSCAQVRWHAVRGAAPAAHASEAQSHGPGFCSSYGNEFLEEKVDSEKARELHWKALSWLGNLRLTTANDAWDQPLWETAPTFVCTTV